MPHGENWADYDAPARSRSQERPRPSHALGIFSADESQSPALNLIPCVLHRFLVRGAPDLCLDSRASAAAGDATRPTTHRSASTLSCCRPERERERESAATGNMPGPGAEARRREGQQCYECGRPTHFQVRRGDKGANRKVRIGRSRSGSQRVSESDMFATFLGEKCLGLSVTPSEDITAAVETSPSTVILLGSRAM